MTTPQPEAFSWHLIDNIPVIVLPRQVERSNAQEFRAFLSDNVSLRSPIALFDFTHVEWFDSTALGVMASFAKPPNFAIMFNVSPSMMLVFQSMYFKNRSGLLWAQDEVSAVGLAFETLRKGGQNFA